MIQDIYYIHFPMFPRIFVIKVHYVLVPMYVVQYVQ
jgi:hypothetical protein